MVCSRHHIHCSCGGDKASRKWLFCADFKRCLRGAAGRAAAQARAVLGNSGGRTAVAADYLALVTRFAERTGGGTAGRAHRVAPPVWQRGTERGVRAQRGPSVRERCRNYTSPPVFMGRVNQMPMFRDCTWGPKYALRKAVNQVNSAPQGRRSSVEGGSTYVVVGETW
jgi:hypothetical protein